MSSLFTALQVSQSVTSVIDLLEVIKHSSLIINFVLFFLIFLSVACWAIIIFKFIQYRKAIIATEQFIEIFWKNVDFKDINSKSKLFLDSPITRVFQAGYTEFYNTKMVWEEKGIQVTGTKVDELVTNIERAMKREGHTHIQILENKLPFLATTASAAPFLGLFGTVWGIMSAFHEIGKAGNATLATIAPSLSEALITTAFGLIAAIPAAIFFNYFNSKLQKIEGEAGNIISDFLNYIKRSVV